MACTHCDDTGSLLRSLDGDLDCGHCNVATERAKLDAWIRQLYIRGDLLEHIRSSDAWVIYQHGAEAVVAGQDQ